MDARMALAALLGVALGGCGSAADDERTGAVVGGTGPLPGFVQGLHYRTRDHSGYTDASGRFHYHAGESVAFSVGPLELEPVKGAALVSPFQLANGSGCGVGSALDNVLQVLQSLDQDGNPDNGLALPELPVSDPPVAVAKLDAAGLAAAVAAIAPSAKLVAADVARDRFIRQVDSEEWTAGEGTTFPFPDSIQRGQGVATDGKQWFFSSTNHLQRANDAFEPQVDNAQPIPLDIYKLGGNHIGDIDVFDGKLYAPIEDGPAYLHPYVVTYDATTLEPTGDELLLPQNLLTKGVPWVAVDGPRKRVYTAEWDPTLRINQFDLANGLALIGTLELVTPIGRIQGAKVFGGEMYASRDDDQKTIYKIDLDTGTVIELFTLGATGTEVEGLALRREADGVHLHVSDVVVPTLKFYDYLRTRDPLRDSICP